MIVDIGSKDGKTFHYEIQAESARALDGKKIGDKIEGKQIDAKFQGYKFEITGLSNSAGFGARGDLDGSTLKKVLLTKGLGFKGKGGRLSKKRKINGLRKRKTVRGNTIASDISQINIKVLEEGKAKLAELLGAGKAVEGDEAKAGADAKSIKEVKPSEEKEIKEVLKSVEVKEKAEEKTESKEDKSVSKEEAEGKK